MTRRQEKQSLDGHWYFHDDNCLFGMMLQYMISEMKEADIWPNVQTYSLLMDGYAMVNQPRKASQVMQGCVDDGHKVIPAHADFVFTFYSAFQFACGLPFSLLSGPS